MEERLNSLEKKQADLLAKASKDDFVNWLANPLTKALILQCQLDAENVKDMWSAGNFMSDEADYYRGQAAYAENQPDMIRGLKAHDQG